MKVIIDRILIAAIAILQTKCYVNLAVADGAFFRHRSPLESRIPYLNDLELLKRRIDKLKEFDPTTGTSVETSTKERLRKIDEVNGRKRGVILLESKTNSETNSSQRRSSLSFYQEYKPRGVDENYRSPKVAELQAKTTILPQTTLNALRRSLLVHPFKTWKLKNRFTSMKDIRIHEDKLHAVIANGRNERLKQKLNKVLRGEDVYFDVFGGSNTAGGGLLKDEGDIEGIYPKVITHWWGKAITPITGSTLNIRQVAMGGTSSDFFQFCFGSYIHEQLDLVFLEMSVNDMRILPFGANKSLPLEQLTRQLLEYPTEPALVYVNLFNGHTCKEDCINLEDYGQGVLSDMYNITSLNWRDAVCQRHGKNKRCDLKGCEVICKDHYHMNQLGHAHISLMIINLFRRILFDHISSVIRNPRDFASGDTKSTRGLRGMITHGSDGLKTSLRRDGNRDPRGTSRQKIYLPPAAFIKKTTNLIFKPLCWTTLTPNFQKNVIKNNLDIVVTKTEGFYMAQNKRLGGKCKRPCRVDGYSSWSGHDVGATTSLAFTVPARISRDGIKSRSVIIAVRTCWTCGAARMWLDSDHQKKYVSSKLKHGRTSVVIVAQRVEPGARILNIEIVKKGDVDIIAVMIGPPDGPYS